MFSKLNTLNAFLASNVSSLKYFVYIAKEISDKVLLTYLMALVSFYTPRKDRKTSGLLIFSEGIVGDSEAALQRCSYEKVF